MNGQSADLGRSTHGIGIANDNGIIAGNRRIIARGEIKEVATRLLCQAANDLTGIAGGLE